MRSLRRSLAMNVFQRWRTSIPFVLALGTLLYIIWAVWLGITSPFDGIASIDRNGLIGELDPRYQNAQVLQVNDIVLEVDGIPYKEAFPTYAGKHAGSTVLLSVQRGEHIIPIAIQLTNPPFQEILTRLLPVLAALIFLGVAAGVQAFLPAYEATNLFFLLFAASAVMLTTGPVTFFGPWWLSGIFWFLILIIGPLAVHFHFYFPQTTDFRFKRPLLYSLYAIAIIGSVLYFLAAPLNILTSPWFGDFLAGIEIFLAINLLIVVSLLVYVYRHANSPGVRSKIRIVVLGGALSLMAFVQLSILPDALLHQPIIPYTFAFLLLCIIPLTYGYAIFRHRLIEIEKHINRGATIILVYTLLGATYLILYSLISRWIPPTLAGGALVLNTVLVLFLASIFIPVQKRVQHLVDTVFYGGWYDYRSAVTQISQGLEQVTNLRSLAIVLADRLVTTLRLEDGCVFLRDLEGDFSVIEVAPRDVLREPGPTRFTNLPRSSLTFLLKMGDEVGRSSLRDAMAEVTFTAEERELLNTEQDHLWVPVIGHAQVQGMLALGPKYGGDIFSNEDIDILRIIARQIGPLVENIHLLTQLRQHAAELEVRVEERTVELYTAKTRVEAILASVGDGVIVTDLDGTILTVNGAYVEQSGEQASELIGKQFYDLLAKQNEANILADMRSILQQGRVWIGELIKPAQRRRAVRRPINCSARPRPKREHGGFRRQPARYYPPKGAGPA